MTLLSELRVMIVGNNNAGSAPIRMYRHLRDRVETGEVCFVGHPLIEEDSRRSQLLRYVGPRHGAGHREWNFSIRRERGLGLLSYVLDVPITLVFFLITRRKYDLYVATGQLLVLVGIVLRRLGFVKQVVFWTLDYFPQSFRKSLIRQLYLNLDRQCVQRADYVWNITEAIGEFRLQNGGAKAEGRKAMYTVPHPIDESEFRVARIEEIDRFGILYSGAGLTSPEWGFELLLEAIPTIVRAFPEVFVTITSYQAIPSSVYRLLEKRGIVRHFRILGYVSDPDEYARVVQRHRMGLATYAPIEGSFKRFADPSRVKSYIARGLPVVITRVPPIAREIEEFGAGVVIDYLPDQLVQAVVRLISDSQFYERCRQNAIRLANTYASEKVFARALSPIVQRGNVDSGLRQGP